MKYNFDTVHDRIHDPYSFSLKYQIVAENNPASAMMGFPDGKVPEDAIVMFNADMDFDMAPPIVDACVKTAQFPNYGYSRPRKPYYEAVRRWFKIHYDWEFAAEDVYECSGTHAGIRESLEKFTDRGAGVIVFTPSYGFGGDMAATGRKHVAIDFIQHEDATFSVDWDSFETAAEDPANQALILVQPHNPLGFCYSVEDMQRIARICRANNVLMIADMVHLDIHRKGVHPVPFTKAVGPEKVVALTGLAKTFNISGLSMSNIIIQDPELKARMGFRSAGLTPFGIAAAMAAYTQCDDWVEELNEYIDGLVDYTEKFLQENMPKVKFTRPEASYVMYLDFSEYGLSGEELTRRIAQKAHIVIFNGTSFGGKNADQWQRFCLTSPLSVIKEAMNRLKDAFADLD